MAENNMYSDVKQGREKQVKGYCIDAVTTYVFLCLDLRLRLQHTRLVLCHQLYSYEHGKCFSFPKDPERRSLWLKAVNKSTVSKSAKLCSKHFDEKFYRFGIVEQRRFLLPTAVPTLYLCTNENNTEGKFFKLKTFLLFLISLKISM